MSTPKDFFDENNTPPEEISVTQPFGDERAPVYDGNNNIADPNFIDPIQHDPQYVSFGKVRRTVSDFVADQTDAFVKSYRDETAIVPPELRKKKDESPLSTIQRETDQSKTIKGDSPIAVTEDTGEVQIRRMGVQELEQIQAYMGREDVNFELIKPNLSKINSNKNNDTADVQFKRMIAGIFEEYKKGLDPAGRPILDTGERSFADMLHDADRVGSVDIMLDLLNRKRGDRLYNDFEIIAARRTVLSFTTLAEKAMMKFEKTRSDQDLAEAVQLLNVSAYAQIQLTGVQQDISRALASNKIVASPTKARIQALGTFLETNQVKDFTGKIDDTNVTQFIEANGGRETLLTTLALYKSLPNDISRNKFNRSRLVQTMAHTPAMMVELFQTALLSSGVTHAYNAVGTLAMTELQVVERFLQGEAGEAMAMLKAHATYFPQAFRAMTSAFRHEKSMTDQASKFETGGRQISRHAFGLRRRVDDSEVGKVESAAALAIDGFGVAMRAMGYRPMIAVDEFFKTMARGMELEAISHREASVAAKSFRDSLKLKGELSDNEIEEQVQKVYQTQYATVLNSTSAFEEASEFARMTTFQDELPGFLGKAGKFFNNPAIKTFVPFYKTPTQIVRRVQERTPLGILMPSVIKKIAEGGRSRREALSRMSFGSALFGSVMLASTGGMNRDYVITGYGPRDRRIRAEWMNNNKPYSIGIRKKDAEGNPLDEWTWVSYARYDPISGVLGMAADAADMIWNVNDEDTLFDIVVGGGMVTTRYAATALPMTQFIGELYDLFGSPYVDSESRAERMSELLSKQISTTGAIMKEHVLTGGLYGVPLRGSLERSGFGGDVQDGKMTLDSSFASSVLPSDQYKDFDIPFVDRPTGLTSVTRGYYEMINSICAKTPGCSDKLPPRRNRWGEPQPQSRGTGWEWIQPWKIAKTKGANIVQKELENLNFAFPFLSKSMGEPMIKLNAEQYDKYILLYNNPASSKYAKERFQTDIYGEEILPDTALNTMKKRIQSDSYKNMGLTSTISRGYRTTPATRKHKISELKAIDAQYKDLAKQLMLLEFPELRALIQQRDDYAETELTNPRRLDIPTETEVKAAHEQNMRELFGLD